MGSAPRYAFAEETEFGSNNSPVSLDSIAAAGHQRGHIVAGNSRDGDPSQAVPKSDVAHARSGRQGIRGTHVRDYLGAPRTACGEHSLHPFPQPDVEAGVGIASLRLLSDGDRALGETFEDQEVEIAAFDELHGRLHPSPE